MSDIERRMMAFYNESAIYRDLLSTPGVFQRDAALDNYVSIVSRHASSGGVLLDLGCGTGESTAQLAARGCRVVGLDISALLLSQSLETKGSVGPRFVIGDIVRLPFRTGSVGCVGLHNVIEHVPDTDGLLREILRVLRPGGRVIIVSPNLLSPVRPLRHVLGVGGFDTRFYGSGWKAILAIFTNASSIARKTFARRPEFTYRAPLLGADFHCPDDDAVYMANVVDLRKWFDMHGFRAAYLQFRPAHDTIAGRLKSRILRWFPWLDKGFCLIAQPRRP